MLSKREIIYCYDGTFEGFLCCVFESFMHKEIPSGIVSQKDVQPSLLEQYNIETNDKNALKVKKSIPAEMGQEALPFLKDALLSCLPDKELFMLDFMRLGYKAGPKVMNMLANETVNTLAKAVRQLRFEAHKYTGFVRFSDHAGLLFSSIKPKNSVLHILAPHFADRYFNEKFVIYDETHKLICAGAGGRYIISAASDITMPETDATEQTYRDLWKIFYDTIAVEGRENPKCMMNFLPKRYRSHMTEFQTNSQKNKTLPKNKEIKLLA